MSAKLIAVEGDTVRIELNIKLSRSMMESEETLTLPDFVVHSFRPPMEEAMSRL